MMSAEAAVAWFAKEVVLFAVMMIAIWAIRRFVTDAELKKWLTIIIVAIFGGWMFILLLRFAGIM